jgi:CheY-like chemotaxis protein
MVISLLPKVCLPLELAVRLLHIDSDNPIARQLLIRQLTGFDLNVTATSNGEEAVREWESHEPGYFSLAVFDHHMPICDGVEAAKRLRVLESRRRLPPTLCLPSMVLLKLT